MWRALSSLVKHLELIDGSRRTGQAVVRLTFNQQTLHFSNRRAPSAHCQLRVISRSATVAGLEEFFPVTDNPVEEGEKSGRPWLARELRHKSSEDLHKLWYVLLKERNMLMTVRQEANRELFVMPGPERLRKVRRSMARIKVVLFERERALREAKRLMEQPAGEVADSVVKMPVKRPKSYKIWKLVKKNRIRPVKDYKLLKKTGKKRRNVRNYKHIAAVRELELKG